MPSRLRVIVAPLQVGVPSQVNWAAPIALLYHRLKRRPPVGKRLGD